MPDYEKMYYRLAGAIADVIEELDNIADKLKYVQQDMEEYYISCEEKSQIYILDNKTAKIIQCADKSDAKEKKK